MRIIFFVILSVWLSACGVQGAPVTHQTSSQSLTPPAPLPSPTPTFVPTVLVNPDFLDVVGATPNQQYTSEASVSGFTGAVTIYSAQGGAELSLDGITWASSVSAIAGNAIKIRMNAPAAADTLQTATITAGATTLDWVISTHAATSTFSTTGNHTWTNVRVGRSVKVQCWGAGGGGGAGGGSGTYGGGGGGGGYSEQIFDRTVLESTEIVTIGTGGAQVNEGTPSTFGARLLADGGKGGKNAAGGSTPGTGGVGITAKGGDGSGVTGGKGGGANGGAGGANGSPGLEPGGGGGGTFGAGGGGIFGNGGGTGGRGGNGRCIVTRVP